MSGKTDRNYDKRGGMRLVMLVTGIFLVIISPIIGAIPGPGFIIVFPIGMALILKSSRTAKRLYIRFKDRFPRYGRWTDTLMRRRKLRRHADLKNADDGTAA